MKRKGVENWTFAIAVIIIVIVSMLLAAIVLGWVENAHEFLVRQATK